MNLISHVAIVVVPRWVRVLVVVILATLSIIYLGLSVLGIYDSTRPGWIEAGTYILGILQPFVLIGLILGFGESGVDGLVRRNAEFLSDTLPKLAVMIGDPDTGMTAAPTRTLKLSSAPAIQVQAARNSSIANYCMTIDADYARNLDGYGHTRQLVFRVELNAMKANVNVMLPVAAKARSLRDLLPHSIAGAEKEGYWFAETPVLRKFPQGEFISLVGVIRLGAEFMTSPVQRLQFGQDLMLMLRSFLHERPDLFAIVPADAG